MLDFKANAGRFGVGPGRIVVMGSSAGGFNALGVAFDPEDAGTSGHPGYSSAVAAAISVGGSDEEVEDIGFDEVPIAMMHALDDTTVPIAAARLTCSQTSLFGNVCRFFEYAGGGHPPRFLREHRRQVTEQASRFICREALPDGVC